MPKKQITITIDQEVIDLLEKHKPRLVPLSRFVNQILNDYVGIDTKSKDK